MILESSLYPFDLLCVGAVIVAVVSLLLPKSIEMQRKRKPEDTSEQERNIAAD